MSIPNDSRALTLEQFWSWAAIHYNCILRAGNDSCLVFDHPYIHWHLAREEGLLFIQAIRGKDLLAEFAIDPNIVIYVESNPQPEEEQVIFDLVARVNGEPLSIFHFLMAHGYDEDEETSRRGWTH